MVAAGRGAVLSGDCCSMCVPTIVYVCRENIMADGIKELQQRMLDMEKELEMKEAMNKQVTKEVRPLLFNSTVHLDTA